MAPVIVALSAAWADGYFLWLPALLCLLFALLMQVLANFVNDFLDFRNGTDGEDRLGPERACAQGWVTPHAMLFAIVIVIFLATFVGTPLILWGGMNMALIGAACFVGSITYTTTLSRIALGDLMVLVFFGLVPVCATYYLQTGTLSRNIILASVAMGLVTDCLLLVNNYRDRETDRRVGKRTLVVLIGSRNTERLYLAVGIIGVALCLPATIVPVLWLPLHLSNTLRMRRIHQGKALNAVLGRTAMAILLFALLYSTGVILLPS